MAAAVPGTRPPVWGGSVSTSVLIVVTFSTVGLVMLAGTSRGTQSQWLGLFLLLVASPFANVLARNGHPLGGLSGLLTLVHLEAALPVVLWRFVSVFPRGQGGFDADALYSATDILAVGPVVVASILLERLPSDLVTATYWPLLVLALLPAAPVLITRTRDASPGERRRVAVLVSGIAVGLLPMSLDIVLRTTSGAWRAAMASPLNSQVVTTIAIAALLTVPLTTAYSVLVARVFDFRLVIRTALKYALARTTILILILVPSAVLLRRVYEHRDSTVQALFSGSTGTISLGVAALAVLALISRRPLLAVLDRRFFRDVSRSETVLTQVVETCRTASSAAEMAALVAEGVSKGLRVTSAAFLVMEPSSGEFVTLKGDTAFLRPDSALVGLLTLSDLPLVTTDTHEHSLLRRIDVWSREWIVASGANLLVPARSLDGRLLGILVLGSKKSDIEYSREDHQLLAAVGSAAGLCLTRHGEATRKQSLARLEKTDWEHSPARECPECGLVHSSTAVFCGCGALLEEADVPQVLVGKYTVNKRIGRGGMGIVYSARDASLLRNVAIKTLPRSSADQVSRLRREAQAMARLTHPHLAGIYGLELWQDRPCLVVELLDGGTLATRLESGALPLPEILGFGRQIGLALMALHAERILHRDVKPSNIGFTASRTAKLLDFGLARTAAHAPEDDLEPQQFRTVSGILAGTPVYLPPEAFDGVEPSEAFDLWALAVVLCESATGHNPFKGGSLAETYDRIRRGVDRRTHIPGELGAFGDFLESALAPDPARRPATAAAFLTALNRLSTQES